VLDALGALSHDDREVLVFRYIVGLTEAETAVSIAAPVGTVKSRSSRALGRLREALGVEVDK
jgi:RNA polymerase sigma-70 factor (ECF subfamily)